MDLVFRTDTDSELMIEDLKKWTGIPDIQTLLDYALCSCWAMEEPAEAIATKVQTKPQRKNRSHLRLVVGNQIKHSA